MADRFNVNKDDSRIRYGLPEEASDAFVTSAKNTSAPAGTSEEADGYSGSASGTTGADAGSWRRSQNSDGMDARQLAEFEKSDESGNDGNKQPGDDGDHVDTEGTQTWSMGKRILRCLLYGLILGLVLIVLEGAWRDDVVEGVIGVADSSILGAPLVAFMVALLESGSRWLMTLRASRHPGFDRERFLGYLGAGFWITLGFELIACLVGLLGGGVMDVNIRFSTVICQLATLVIMAVLMWQGYALRSLLWSVLLYFLWLTPLLLVLPGSRVITASQRSIVTFELVYGAVLCLIALIICVRNRKKTQEDIEERAAKRAEKKAAKADKKLARKAAKAATATDAGEDTRDNAGAGSVTGRDSEGTRLAARSSGVTGTSAEDNLREAGESGEKNSIFGREEQSLKSVEQKYLDDEEEDVPAEEKYSGGNVEDRYL